MTWRDATKHVFLFCSTIALGFGCGDDDNNAPDSSASDGAVRDTTDFDQSSLDGSTPDGGSDAGPITSPWLWCPTSADFVGDATWSDRVVVQEIFWCVMGSEGLSLDEVLANKAQLWMAPGTYPFPPRENATGDMTLPFCVNTADGEGPTPTGSIFSVSVDDSLSTFDLISSSDGPRFQIHTFIEHRGMPIPWPGGDIGTELDGGFGTAGSWRGLLVYGGGLAPCDGSPDWEQLMASATFEGGNVQFAYDAIRGSVATGPSGGFHATGSLDDVNFDVSDYFRIVYAPEHHHFGGEYIVLFDDAIRGACGLRLNAAFDDESVSLVNCDLSMREVLTASMIIGPSG